MEHFGGSLRLELAHHGVAVGVAHPGWVDTDMVRDPRRDLRSFERMLGGLPGPFGKVTPVRECAAAFVEAIERRSRKVFVPRSLGPLAAVRQLFASPAAGRVMEKRTRRRLPPMEQEIRSLGRIFGENSVEAGERKER